MKPSGSGVIMVQLFLTNLLYIETRKTRHSVGSFKFHNHTTFLFFFRFPCFLVLHKQCNIHPILTKCKTNTCSAHIYHIEFGFHLGLLRAFETLWFWCDNSTTVLERNLLWILILCIGLCMVLLFDTCKMYELSRGQ